MYIVKLLNRPRTLIPQMDPLPPGKNCLDPRMNFGSQIVSQGIKGQKHFLRKSSGCTDTVLAENDGLENQTLKIYNDALRIADVF